MNDTMRAGILAVAVVLFASFAMLAVPASDAEGTEPTQMTADEFLKGLSDGKLVMDKDVELTSALNIATEMELDLAGHKLVNGTAAQTTDGTVFDTIKVSNGGKLTVTDSVGGGIVDNVSHAKAALHVDAGAEAILNGGTFERSLEAGYDGKNSGGNSWYTIANRGTVTINNGVTVLNGDAKTTGLYSSMIGNGYPSAGDNTDGHDVVLTINGGTFTGGKWNLKNDDYGIATVNGGTFQASSGLCNVLTWNDLTVNGGTFKSDDCAIVARDAAVEYNDGLVTMTGGVFDCPNELICFEDAVGVYTVDIALSGIKEGKTILTTFDGPTLSGKVSINGNAVDLKDIKAGEGFALSVGSIDISGAYTSTADGSITVNGDCKLSGTIDGNVTVKVASGSITVPEGKTLTGTIQMGGSNKVELSVTAGAGGLTVTPSTIGGTATGAGTIDITGKVTVKGALTLGEVELSVPVGSELSVPKDATVSGGEVVNAGTVIVDGAVESKIANTGKVSAAVDAKVSDVEGGDFEQAKPVIQRTTFDAEVAVGEVVRIAIKVTEGADVELTGAEWASYKDGFITGTPTKEGQCKIFATPSIGKNVGETVVFTVNVTEATEPINPVEPDDGKETETGGNGFMIIAIILFAIVILILVAMRII